MSWGKKQTFRILAKGGILTTTHLLNILKIAKLGGTNFVHFGSRQDVLFYVDDISLEMAKEAFGDLETDFVVRGQVKQNAQNIVSSYVASDLMASTPWVSSGSILHVLENFKYKPKLRVNIADPAQTLVPLLFGHLNFIASPIQHFWYLYIRRYDEDVPVRWPVLVLSEDIATLSEAIERNWNYFSQGGMPEWFETMKDLVSYTSRNVESELTFTYNYQHDYEGFGKMHNAQNYWAGFYWRNNEYDIAFLEEVCFLCAQTGIAKLCITPWKSFMIKDIAEKDLVTWHRLLGRYGITMRHSLFELNWHLPLHDKKALKLKQRVVEYFDKRDVCVHGLTFGVKTKPEPSFYSVKIERRDGFKVLGQIDVFVKYKISYVKDFNPNLCEFIEVATVSASQVPKVLQKLTLKFYEQLHGSSLAIGKRIEKVEKVQHQVYQCNNCLTIYDEKKGNLAKNIPPQTPFNSLSSDFCCPLCDAPKDAFEPLYFEDIVNSAN